MVFSQRWLNVGLLDEYTLQMVCCERCLYCERKCCIVVYVLAALKVLLFPLHYSVPILKLLFRIWKRIYIFVPPSQPNIHFIHIYSIQNAIKFICRSRLPFQIESLKFDAAMHF